MQSNVLTPEAVSERVHTLAPGWTAELGMLKRTVEFPSFLVAVQFIVALADVAERLDHHPDVRLSWRTVELSLSTHSAGGVTETDFDLAAGLDPLIARLAG